MIANTGCSPVWDLVERNRKLFGVCGVLLRSVGVLLSKRFAQKCPKCQLLVDNRVEHLICHCAKNLKIRKAVWDLVIDIGGINLFTKLMYMSQLEQCGFLLCMAVDNCDDYLLHMNFAIMLRKCLT